MDQHWLQEIPGLFHLESQPRPVEYEHLVMKVNQYDSKILDSELLDLVMHQITRIFSFFRDGTVEKFKPEVNALLSFLLYRWTIYLNKPTPGMSLQNLKYEQADGTGAASVSGGAPVSGARLVARGLVDVLGRYCVARLRRVGLAQGWGEAPEGTMEQKTWQFLNYFEKFQRLAWLVNTLLFLRSGKYPTFLDRLLGMRMVYAQMSTSPRAINFQFMSRQLLWEYFANLLVFLAPLVDWDRIRQKLRSALQRQRRLISQGRGPTPPTARNITNSISCVACNREPAQTPYIASCRHTFCYYCLRTGFSREEHYRCPVCGENIEFSHVWSADR
mmetsp:Transcript_22942/g.29956  ORF Transcript_22942/g.29956 Transcript_22942/m.29956 type:complete len:331 (-) Transcript_22942:196-1188(-)